MISLVKQAWLDVKIIPFRGFFLESEEVHHIVNNTALLITIFENIAYLRSFHINLFVLVASW